MLPVTTEVENIPLAACGENNGGKWAVEMFKEIVKFLPTLNLSNKQCSLNCKIYYPVLLCYATAAYLSLLYSVNV